MKRAFFMAFLISLFATSVLFMTACDQDAGSPGQAVPEDDVVGEAAGPAPKIAFDSQEFDFGRVDSGDSIEHAFTFKNEGQGDLTIKQVRSSCGCTAALVSNKTIEPGKSGEINTTFKTKGYQGRVTKTVRVQTDDPGNPNITLKISGTIVAEVMMEPRSVNFGNLKSGEEAAREVTLSFAPGKNISIKDLSSTSAFFKIETQPLDGDEEGVVVRITAHKALPIGCNTERITILTSSERMGTLQIPVYAFVQGDIAISPQILSFRKSGTTGLTSRTLTVATSGAEFKIAGVEVSSTLFTAETKEVEPGKKYEIVVKMADAVKDGRIHEKLLIKTDNAQQPLITIPIYGSVGDFSKMKNDMMMKKDRREFAEPIVRGQSDMRFNPDEMRKKGGETGTISEEN